MKGSKGRYAARELLDWIGESGDKDRTVILLTDQEPVVKFFVEDVCDGENWSKDSFQ